MNLLQIIIRSIAFLCLLIIFTTPAVTAATISVHKKHQKKKGADEIALFSKKRKRASVSELISIDSTRISQELVEPTHDADFNNKYLPVFGVGNDNEIRPTSLRTRGLSQFANAIGLRSSNLIVVDGEVLPRQSMKNLSIADVIRVEAWRGLRVLRLVKMPQQGLFSMRLGVLKLGGSSKGFCANQSVSRF